MSAVDDECLKISIKEKQPIEWTSTNQVVVKFKTTDDQEEVTTPESDKSPMLSPTRPTCLKNPWKGSPSLNRTFSSSRGLTCVREDIRKKLEMNKEEQKRGSPRENTGGGTASSKKFYLGEEISSSDQSDLEKEIIEENLPEDNLPKIMISTETGKIIESEMMQPKFGSLHVSLPDVALKTSYSNNVIGDKRKLYPEFLQVNNDFIKCREKLSLEEDRRNLARLISNLQNIVDSMSEKYERLESNKSNKQLNFRSHDDIINTTKELMPSEFVKANAEYETLNRPETKRPGDFSFYFRNKNRMEGPDCDLFLETERLLDGKTNGIPLLRWSDANSITSPCSTVPESPFESGKKIRSQNLIFPKRSVLKNGECNVLKKSSNSKRRVRYLQDIFTTLVDVKWRWTLVVFALSFIMSWLFYAGLYWLIAYAHGDFDHLKDENWTPCVENLMNFASCFLFSVETQHTIGYGGRATTEECPEAIFVMCIQSITGVMISAFMAGIFFAKMARPKQRRQTLLFSRKAVICQRDAQMCLMFRVGDMRKSHIIGTNIRAHIFRSRTTREGEELPQYQCELQVLADGCESNIFFIWPLTIVHVIDKDSPLYSMSAQDLLQENFEVVAILEGTVESTGQTTQARTSYLPNEIKWGHRFESLLSYNTDRQCYEIDYKKFNNTVKVATPLCSAKDLEELYMIQSEMCDYNVVTSDPETDNQ